MSEIFRKVLIVGAGELGSQIARTIALTWRDVLLYDKSDEALIKAENRVNLNNVKCISKLDAEVKGCNLVIESITEVLKIKQNLFAFLENIVNKDAVIVTNSSMLLPSRIAKKIKYKGRFCGFHFYWPDEGANIVDIMPIKKTDHEIPQTLKEFALECGLEPIVIKKENRGYVYNDMFSSFNGRALSIVIRGVASIEDVDKSFRNVTKSPRGPFEMMDIVGLDTVMHITKNMAKRNPVNYFAVRFLKKYVEQGKLGVKTGEGFYKY